MNKVFEEYPCQNCGKMNICRNYCDWDCHVTATKNDGGVVITPNGLPIKCIKADGTMLEHEHGDHPDYKFPVDVDFVGEVLDGHVSDYEAITGKLPDSADDVRKSMGETHALIYSDGYIAVTIYECCYAMWNLNNGHIKYGSLWKTGEWRMAQASIDEIREHTK